VPGNALDLFGQAIGAKAFHGLKNLSMERAPSLVKQPRIDDLMGQRVLEGIFEIWEKMYLVQILGGLKTRKAPVHVRLGQFSEDLQQTERHVLADDCGGLEEALVVRREPIDPCRQDCLHGGRHLDGLEFLRQPVCSRLADQRPRFHERSDTLLEKQRVTLGPLNQSPFERFETRVRPQQARQQVVRALRGEGIDAELSIVGLAPPAVLIFRAVVDQQQEPSGGEAFD
jgi:hypothetical protein